MKKFLTLFVGYCLFQSVIADAKHVLPVFSGLWCASIECQNQKGYFVNNCGYWHASPKCHLCMKSEKKLAETLIGGRLPESWLFNNLSLGRFDAAHPQVKIDPKAEPERLQRKLDHISWYMIERHMKNVFAAPSNLYNVELATVMFQKSVLEPNIEKARFLWNLALKHKDDEIEFKYLIDVMANLKIEDAKLTDEMIDEYYR